VKPEHFPHFFDPESKNFMLKKSRLEIQILELKKEQQSNHEVFIANEHQIIKSRKILNHGKISVLLSVIY